MRDSRICDEYEETGVWQRDGTSYSYASIRSAGRAGRIEKNVRRTIRTGRIEKKLKCVYTVETTFVMAIVLFCFATVIMYAFTERDEMYKRFVTQEAAHNASHIEETWLEDGSDIKAVEELSTEQLGVIPNISGKNISVKRSIFGASAGGDSDKVEEQIYDPENEMRRNSVVENLFSKKGDHHGE